MSLLTVPQLAERLNVTRGWVYERTRLNLIPGCIRLGATLRFDPAVIDAWLISQRQDGTGPTPRQRVS